MNARSVVSRMSGLLFLLSLAAIGTAAGQLAPTTQVATRMVVTAVASKGSDVPTISRDDVMVREGKDRDKVLDWVAATGDHAGLEFFLMIDDSTGENVGSQLEDLRKFILAQPATTKVGVAYMQNGTAQVLQGPTADHQQAAKTLRLPTGVPGVNASPYFSLSDLIKKWPASPNRREVLMITSGVDGYWTSGPDDPYVNSAIEDAQRSGVDCVLDLQPRRRPLWSKLLSRLVWPDVSLPSFGEDRGRVLLQQFFRTCGFVLALPEPACRETASSILAGVRSEASKEAGLQPVKVMTEVPNAELVAADRAWVPATPGAPE